MFTGKMPKFSFHNEVLTSAGHALYAGLRYRLTEVRGDWKHHQQVWGLVGAAFTSNNICHICAASRSKESVSMLEFTREPKWKATVRSHRTFLLEIMSQAGCNLMYVKGFHYGMIRWCSMHCTQLGVGLFCNGGCFHELMKVNWFRGDSAAARYRDAYRKFQSFIRKNNISCSQPMFKPYMYVSSGDESCTFRSKARA